VAIESGWYKRMTETVLYIYEFDTSNFYRQNSNFILQDEIAGYYVSEQTEIPVNVTRYDDLFGELFKRNVEVRILDNLWTLGEAVKQSTLNWSLCRMANAKEPI
jgi:hypothetical protein